MKRQISRQSAILNSALARVPPAMPRVLDKVGIGKAGIGNPPKAPCHVDMTWDPPHAENISYREFVKDEKTIDAVIRNIEIIGEAANNIPEYVKNQHSEIEWRKIVGMRNRLIHGYFGIDYEIVWTVIENQFDNLQVKIENILENE